MEPIDLDKVTVEISFSPLDAKIGDTVTLSANVASPYGMDRLNLQWQYCVLQFNDGNAIANWIDAEDGNTAVYSYTLTEENQQYTWRLNVSEKQTAIETDTVAEDATPAQTDQAAPIADEAPAADPATVTETPAEGEVAVTGEAIPEELLATP